MNLCSSGHDEVCYDGKRCPVCEILEEKRGVEVELKEAKSTIETQQETIDELQGKVFELEKEMVP